MTFECVDIRQIVSLAGTNHQESRRVPSLKLRLQPWLKLSIACVCLFLGPRLLHDSPPLIFATGLALLLRVPAYCYLAWCDFQALKEARVTMTLRWYLQDYWREAPIGTHAA
ncbi:MAG TPA: hypothetical protein VME43_31175 [Bryobacteraceae bacterium]|nr:hypothetical protein [Bryobacteraceae bacterium]